MNRVLYYEKIPPPYSIVRVQEYSTFAHFHYAIYMFVNAMYILYNKTS